MKIKVGLVMMTLDHSSKMNRKYYLPEVSGEMFIYTKSSDESLASRRLK